MRRFLFSSILLLILSACVSSEGILASEIQATQTPFISETAGQIATPTQFSPEITRTPFPMDSPTPAIPSTWAISLLSITTEGSAISAGEAQLSGDGRYAVYLADAQIYLRDLKTNSIKLVSASSEGSPGDDWSFTPAISGDGNTLAFFSFASNLSENPFKECPPEMGGICGSLYIYDVPSENISGVGVAAAQTSVLDVALSDDGQWIAFAASWAFYREGVFLYDRARDHVITIASGDISDPSINTHVGGTAVDISADGHYVAFASPEDGLVPEDVNGVSDVFVYDRETGQIEWTSRAFNRLENNQPSGFQWVPNTGGASESGLSISADGRFVVFMSASPHLMDETLPGCSHWPWVAEEFPACRHIYLYDRETGATELVSRSNHGIPGNRASQDGDISADGRWVVFTSLANNLTADEPIQCQDFSFEGFCPQVFMRDRQNQQTYLMSVGWNGEPANALSYHPAISSDGRMLSFISGAGNLSPGIPFNQSQYAWFVNLTEWLKLTTKHP